MRYVAFDVGARRTGVAVSDVSGTLARPLRTLRGGSPIPAALEVIREFEPDGIGALVVGLPKRLDGSDTDGTARARQFADALARRTGLPVVLQDERLTSVEAEARLAELEPDWRVRKARLDAAAAAVILQEYLDTRPPDGSAQAAPAAEEHA